MLYDSWPSLDVTPISSPRVEKLGLQYDRSNPIVRQLSAL
jgi:hypothetical protein